ncbi:hypothetical protein IH575_04680 [Candidatus Dojkabacteria bacterium]|nr:hypothetical protein [Candidatus Dojkabacteria bacterium]
MKYNNTNLTPTGLAHKLIHELKILGDLLSTTVQKIIIKKFYDYILEHRSSIAEATNLLPLEAALVVIQVREHEAFYHEISELHKRIDKLEWENKELKKMLNEEV